MIEFFEPHQRQNHLNIDADYKDAERLLFNARYCKAVYQTKNQTVVKSYILDNQKYGRAKA